MLLVVEAGPPQLNLLQLQSVIDLDVAVTCGWASSQSVELGHRWVVGKFVPDEIQEFS